MTIKVNLLPTERKRFTFDPMIAILFVLVCLCLVGFVVFGIQLQEKIDASRAKVAGVEDEIKKIEQSLPVIDDLKTQISKLEDEIKVVKSLKYDPVRYGNLLTEVGRILPDNVWITNLAVEPSTATVTMSGVAAHVGNHAPLETIATLIKHMDDSQIFTESSLSSTSQTKSGNSGVGFSFQIEAHYNPDIAAGLADEPKSTTTDANAENSESES